MAAGAKGKYCPEIVEKIAGYVAEGNYASVACALAGVSEASYYAWLKDESKPEFLEAIKEAEAVAEAESIKSIREAGNSGSWQAHAWYLERKFKDRWTKEETKNINHSGQIDPSKRTLDDYYKDSGTT